jgi:hypothetical protein
LDSLYIDTMTFDDLAMLQDSNLATRIRQIRSLIDKSHRRGFTTRRLEVELCYTEREMDIRAARQRYTNRLG